MGWQYSPFITFWLFIVLRAIIALALFLPALSLSVVAVLSIGSNASVTSLRRAIINSNIATGITSSCPHR